jgi:plasmid stabilization system protein ParE
MRGATAPHDRHDRHPEPFDNLDEIAAYIGQDSPESAHRVIDEIHPTISRLLPSPHQGAAVPSSMGRPLRFIRFRD